LSKMVRFSDIDGIRDKPESQTKKTDYESEAGEFRLADAKTRSEKMGDEEFAAESAGLEVGALYEKIIGKALETKNRVLNSEGLSPSPILSDLRHIIDKQLIDALYEYAMTDEADYDEFVVQNVDVTFAALKIGVGMDYDNRKLLELGLAAFFQNVGIYQVPEHILKKEGPLDKPEVEVIQQHPEVGAKILSGLGSKYGWLVDVVLQVHERSDGSGYPKGLKGPEISELASIIGLMDMYVAMIKKRPHRDRVLPPNAVKYIVKEAKEQFPPRILKVFLNQISLFPVNTYVRLNNKSIGRVIATDENQPLRPTIMLLYDGLGEKVGRRKSVNLASNPLLYIVDCLDEKGLG
jgi:HD-GYP domain-containing protein (c-di-GMP phosphodiesterase class II)